MKKILFISYDGMTDPLGQSQVIPYLCGLTRYGYRFTILSCDKPGNYESQKEDVFHLLKNYDIQWESIPYHKNPPVLSSILDYYALRRKAEQLHHRNNYDMVHTRPGLPTLVALWMKKKYGCGFLNDVRGFWADERVDGGMWNLNNPVYRVVYHFFKKHEKECLEKADYNTCLTHAAEKEMLKWDHANKTIPGIRVIPCSADLELFHPGKIDTDIRTAFAGKLGITGTGLIISYLGSIGGWYLTAEMMRFCKKVADKIPGVKFLFISPHRHDAIMEAASNYGIPPGQLIITAAKRDEVPVLLSFSDYSLFFIKPCYSKLSSSPTKHGEIMAMGIPVITNSGVGDVKEIVTKYKSGYVVEDFSDASFDAVIDKILAGNNFDKQKIIDGAEEYYSLAKAIDGYCEVYARILS
ncbi:MAG TPA: glycosyltransferase [Ferruginibacter sp.]|nr:glycosyltransferase [Ferruginibacter sp.]